MKAEDAVTLRDRCTARRRIAAMALGLFFLGMPAVGHAEEPAAAESTGEDNFEQLGRQFLFSRLQEYQVRPVDRPDSPLVLDETLLLAWHNAVSGAEAGSIYVWTDAGRPAVIAKAHINRSKSAWIDTLVPFTSAPIEMAHGGSVRWQPAEPEVVELMLADAGEVPTTEHGRQVRMRSIARRFQAAGTWGEETPSQWEFRLMPSPLYRYTSPPNGVVDGAMFGYAQGTNPEIVLLIEAVQGEAGELGWRVAATRLTRYAVQLSWNGGLIMDLPRLDRGPVTAPFYQSYNPYSGDPFAADGPQP